jgi:hypothetical protein
MPEHRLKLKDKAMKSKTSKRADAAGSAAERSVGAMHGAIDFIVPSRFPNAQTERFAVDSPLAQMLARFDPARHGGEAMADPPVGNEAFARPGEHI